MGKADRGAGSGNPRSSGEAEMGELLLEGLANVRPGAAEAARAVPCQVIVHELLHSKVANRGRLFRALLKAYLAHCR